MQEAFVNINNIPTKVLTYGRWITEKPEKDEDKIILIIPGNPGVTGFYKTFMKVLYDKHKCPVWIISHTGHERQRQKSIKTDFPPNLISLKEQTKQKASFIEEYVPENVKLHIIAHSIGSYMTLELLKEPNIEKRIVQTYLLFPTIEDMISTTNGKFLYHIVKPMVSVIIFLSWIFTILPKLISMNLLKMYMLLKNMPVKDRDPVITLIHPKILKQVFYLAFQELEEVKERDNENIKNNLNRINILYGEADGWYHADCYNNIKTDFPHIRARMSKYSHTFVFHENEEVAEIVNKWMSDEST